MENDIKKRGKKKIKDIMKELSLHILDIVQNSIQAKASRIEICIHENNSTNKLEITISDNGEGMSEGTIRQVLNPFYTTKNKKTGLGIPLLKQHTEMTGGSLTIKSKERKGTTVSAIFTKDHMDRQPIGNIAGTLTGLIRSNPSIHFRYLHQVDIKKFELDTDELLNELDGLKINSTEVIQFLEQMITENMHEMNSE